MLEKMIIENYEKAYRRWGLKYPYAGYGDSFMSWLNSDNPKPYNSWGNGSAMRVSPVGFLFDYKEKIGNFISIEDLKNIEGIGKNKFAQLKSRLKVRE